jgi:hypothetical protein
MWKEIEFVLWNFEEIRKTTKRCSYSSLYRSKILTVHSPHTFQKCYPLNLGVILCTVTVKVTRSLSLYLTKYRAMKASVEAEVNG